MRTALAILLLVLVAFSGCTSGDDPSSTVPESSAGGDAGGDGTTTGPSAETDGDDTGDTDTGDPDDENGVVGSDDAEDGENQTMQNTPPTATLSASIHNGSVPLSVDFTLDGADIDGDRLTWTFDADSDGALDAEGDGAQLPADVSFNYTEEGVFTALLTVHDGHNETTASVAINVTAAAAGAGPVQEVSVSWVVGVLDAGAATEILACNSSPLEGITHGWFAADPATIGRPFAATVTDASGGTALDSWSVFFFTADCLGFTNMDASGADPINGVVPEDAAWVATISAGGAMLEAHYIAG